MRRWCSLHASIVRKRQNTLLHAVFPKNTLRKTGIMSRACKSTYTRLLRPFTSTAYQQLHYSTRPLQLHRDALCMTLYDTTAAVWWNFSLVWWPASSTSYSNKPRQKKEPNGNVTLIDVNWTVTVIIRFRLALELNIDDTAFSAASAPSWTRTTVIGMASRE